MACFRFLVSGRVQGVGFRQATARRAQGLSLRGWVRNLGDGRVEGVAAGEPSALEQLRAWLEQGPPTARVDGLVWEAAADGRCDGGDDGGFTIVTTRP